MVARKPLPESGGPCRSHGRFKAGQRLHPAQEQEQLCRSSPADHRRRLLHDLAAQRIRAARVGEAAGRTRDRDLDPPAASSAPNRSLVNADRFIVPPSAAVAGGAAGRPWENHGVAGSNQKSSTSPFRFSAKRVTTRVPMARRFAAASPLVRSTPLKKPPSAVSALFSMT